MSHTVRAAHIEEDFDLWIGCGLDYRRVTLFTAFSIGFEMACQRAATVILANAVEPQSDEQTNVCPDCHGKGAQTENGVEFCNCEEAK